MQKISVDIETFSDVDLIKCGVYKYADSPAFEILLFAYSIDDGEIHIIDFASGETLPEEIIGAIKSDTVRDVSQEESKCTETVSITIYRFYCFNI